MKVLVLGGAGTFGAPICRALAAMPGVEVVVAGRDGARTRAFADSLGASWRTLDARDPALAAGLERSGCDWIVHAAGPFQGMGHDVAAAAIRARLHYADIADARAFVCGIRSLDAAARAAGVAVVSGVSSVPALSGAVVDRYAAELAALESIEMGIVSSSRLPGPATVRGVLSYCGRPFEAWIDGRWQRLQGWQGLRRQVFSTVPMSRWISDCDVPDLELLPTRHPTLRSVRFGAGAGSTPAQLALYAASAFGRIAPLPRALVSSLQAAGRWLEPLGSPRSGMFVVLGGTGHDGRPLRITWELVAEDHRGREIPSLGAVALVRKAARESLPAGARACVGTVSLDEYLAELRGMPVSVGVRRDA